MGGSLPLDIHQHDIATPCPARDQRSPRRIMRCQVRLCVRRKRSATRTARAHEAGVTHTHAPRGTAPAGGSLMAERDRVVPATRALRAIRERRASPARRQPRRALSDRYCKQTEQRRRPSAAASGTARRQERRPARAARVEGSFYQRSKPDGRPTGTSEGRACCVGPSVGRPLSVRSDAVAPRRIGPDAHRRGNIVAGGGGAQRPG